MKRVTLEARCLALLPALALLAGCGSNEPAPPLEDRYRGTLSISPEPAEPGDRLSVQLRNGAGAPGRHYALQEWDGDAWRDDHCMASDASGPREDELPAAKRPGLGGLGCLERSEAQSRMDMWPPDNSPMIEHLRLPDELDAGIYRLCEMSDRSRGCALLEVSSTS